MYKRVKSHLLQ